MAIILCILAGGRSSRFGQSKLRVQVDGQPVLSWLLRKHESLGAESCWLSLGPDQVLPPGADAFEKIIRDVASHCGPLHGVKAAVDAADPEDHLLILPADMLLIPTDYLQVLLNCLSLDDQQAAIMGKWALGEDAGRVEPLPSAWRAGTGRVVLEQAIEAGLGGPAQMADYPGIGKTFLHWEEQKSQFMSINRRKDLPHIAQLLEAELTVARAD